MCAAPRAAHMRERRGAQHRRQALGWAGARLDHGERAGRAADADHAQVCQPLARRLEVLQQAQAHGWHRLRPQSIPSMTVSLLCASTVVNMVSRTWVTLCAPPDA